MLLKLYFLATKQQAKQILKRGFALSKDGRTCPYALTDQPFAGAATAPCDVLLGIDSASRTFLVPGLFLNHYGVSEVIELEAT